MAASETLKANKREKVGTRSAKKLRADGKIPANLQGEGKEHVDFAIEASDFHTSRRRHIHLYDLDIDGTVESAVVRELQWDVFGSHIIHVEFKRVTRGVKTEADVALEFFGHPKGGMLNHLITHIKVNCLPSEIPDSIEVKVGEMVEGDSIKAGELELPEGMELVTDAAAVVATVSVTRADVADEGETPAGEEGAAPDVGGEPAPDGEGS